MKPSLSLKRSLHKYLKQILKAETDRYSSGKQLWERTLSSRFLNEREVERNVDSIPWISNRLPVRDDGETRCDYHKERNDVFARATDSEWQLRWKNHSRWNAAKKSLIMFLRVRLDHKRGRVFRENSINQGKCWTLWENTWRIRRTATLFESTAYRGLNYT